MNFNDLINLRHQLHTLAEVSGEEKQTAQTIKDFLENTRPDDLLSGVGGHGVMACYEGEAAGPTLMLRCELDALPIPEENEDLSYLSENPETGHKCGHDGHMAILCGVAQRLCENRPVNGKVCLLFQPAEETGQGAERVLKDPAFESVNPDYVFALHNLPGYPKNQIVVRDGTFASASVGLKIRLKGETSHAAYPEEGKNPALALAQLVNTLSSFPQFYASMHDPAKVTVIHARMGEEAFGTSPGYAEVMATLRTYDDDVLEELRNRAVDVARDIADVYELEMDYEWVELFAATRNDPLAVSMVKKAADECGLDLKEKPHPFGWSEDFGHFTKKYKGALFGLGAGTKQPPLHASNYDFPDELIAAGVEMFMGIIYQVTGEQ